MLLCEIVNSNMHLQNRKLNASKCFLELQEDPIKVANVPPCTCG